MNNRFFRKTILALPALILALGMGGCIKERSIDNMGVYGSDVLITVNIPVAKAPTTRSIAAGGGEAAVETIDILVFKSNGLGKPDILAQHVVGQNITQSTNLADNYKVQFKAKLSSETNATSVVILANVPSTTVTTAANVGANKQVVLEALKYASTNGGGTSGGWKWNTNATNKANPTAGTDYTAIPMLGEKLVSGITAGMKIEDIDLARMLARIDVVNRATSQFTLSEVYIVNYNTAGYISPAWNATNGTLLTALPATPMLPSTTNPQTGMANAMLYNYSAGGILGNIYTYEAAATTGTEGNASHTNATCIIVKGTYNAKQYFYRMDFTAAKDAAGKAPGEEGFNPGTVEYMPVYRNHLYRFDITAVIGKGYVNFGDALKSLGIKNNLKAALHVIDESGIKNMAFDGQHYLGVEKKVYEFFSDAEDNYKMKISTNYGYGWKAEVENAASTTWLRFTGGTTTISGAKSVKELAFSVAVNGTGNPRTGYILLTVGRLEMKIAVVQSNNSKYSIIATDGKGTEINELVFSATDLGPKTLRIDWKPENADLNIVKSVVGSLPQFSAASGIPATGTVAGGNVGTGTISYSITAPAFLPNEINPAQGGNPFYEKASKLEFAITTPSGPATKEVVVRHMNYAMIPTYEAFYLADGSIYNFNIKTNRPWKAYLIDNGNGMVTKVESVNIPATVSGEILVASGNSNLPGGKNIAFTTFNDLANPIKIIGTAKIRIDWQSGENEGDITSQTIGLFCASKVKPSSNCFMIKNSSTNIEIPTRQVAIAMGLNDRPRTQEATIGYLGMNWITAADYASGKLKVDVLWTDLNVKSYTNGAVVKALSYDGTQHVAAGTITVTPGTGVGNAVICLYIDSNTNGKYNSGEVIKWSWHIWSAGGYYPYDASGIPVGIGTNNVWMDRNLGATGNSSADGLKTFGLLYQWGRKDPFPGASAPAAGTTTLKPLYNATGTTYTLPDWTNDYYSLSKTVNSPGIASKDWAGSIYASQTIDNNSWGGANLLKHAKTVFDPCPDGYRVPVYVNSVNTLATDYWGNERSSIGKKWTTLGINWAEKGGYYPAAGYRFSGGLLMNVGQDGFYWSASPNPDVLYSAMSFLNTSTYPSYPNVGYTGLSVRCVKE